MKDKFLNKNYIIYSMLFSFIMLSCKQKKEVFTSFLNKFTNDSVFQKDRIQEYINIYQIPENDTIVRIKLVGRIKSNDFGFIDFRKDNLHKNKEYVDRDEGFEVRITHTKDSVIYNQIGLGDNLLNYNYIFKKLGNKWFLTDIHELTP